MILLAPYAARTPDGQLSPKNFPYWSAVVKNLKLKTTEIIVQIGKTGESEIKGVDRFLIDLPFAKIAELVEECTIWLSIDSFLPHYAHKLGKKGIVIFALTDPNVFGYPENINMLKDRKHLRKEQFNYLTGVKHSPDAFVNYMDVVDTVIKEVDKQVKSSQVKSSQVK